MTKDWRPDNWDSIKPDVTIISKRLDLVGMATITPNEMFRVGVETGASALLEAVKEVVCQNCLYELRTAYMNY